MSNFKKLKTWIYWSVTDCSSKEVFLLPPICGLRIKRQYLQYLKAKELLFLVFQCSPVVEKCIGPTNSALLKSPWKLDTLLGTMRYKVDFNGVRRRKVKQFRSQRTFGFGRSHYSWAIEIFRKAGYRYFIVKYYPRKRFFRNSHAPFCKQWASQSFKFSLMTFVS